MVDPLCVRNNANVLDTLFSIERFGDDCVAMIVESLWRGWE